MNYFLIAVGVILILLVMKFIGKVMIKTVLLVLIVLAIIYFFKHSF